MVTHKKEKLKMIKDDKILYVSSDLLTIQVDKKDNDIYINQIVKKEKLYLILTPCLYAWLRRKTEKINSIYKSGNLLKKDWDILRNKFYPIHDYAVKVFSKFSIERRLNQKQKNSFSFPGIPRLVDYSECTQADFWAMNVSNGIPASVRKKIAFKSAPMEDLEYIVIYSELLEEKIILIFKEKSFNKIYKLFPGLVIYFLAEIQIMVKTKNVESIKRMHLLKKEFGGFITSIKKKNKNR